jgi:hypothetical protein
MHMLWDERRSWGSIIRKRVKERRNCKIIRGKEDYGDEMETQNIYQGSMALRKRRDPNESPGRIKYNTTLHTDITLFR